MSSFVAPRKNAYDGELEFYVVVRETGARQLEKTEEEVLRSRQKAILFLASFLHIYIYNDIVYSLPGMYLKKIHPMA